VNAYLTRKREQFNATRAEITSLRDKAVAENRDLSPEELALVQSRSAELGPLADEIEALAAEETRVRAVAEVNATLDAGAGTEPTETRAATEVRPAEPLVGTAQVTHRDPGHYRAATEGGEHSFFADHYRASVLRNPDAEQRMAEHVRALASTTEGPGLVAPKWLTERFETVLRQGRMLANAVQNVPLGRDPRPMTLPKQTVGTTTAVGDQAGENSAYTSPDQFDTDVDTITPGTVTGSQIFSRQFLDMATPALDALIYQDLIANYNLQIEKKVGAAMVAAASLQGTAFATEAAFAGTAPAVPAIDAVIDAAIAVRAGRYLPADIIAMGTARFGRFKKLKDTTGRPLLPLVGGTMNINGVGNAVNVEGEIEGLGVLASEGISTGAYADNIVVARAADCLLFEGDLMRFRYEEVSGPQSIKLGVWNYAVVNVRRPGVGQKKITITAA
jgi:HK97 family phage major capsid protein